MNEQPSIKRVEDKYIELGNSLPNDINKQVEDLLRTYRKIISPEKTNKRFRKRKVGEPTSQDPKRKKNANAINNPIKNPINYSSNGPIYRKRKKDKNKAERLAFLQNKRPEIYKQILKATEINKLANELLCMAIIDSLRVLAPTNDFVCYIGLTRRKLEEEDLRFSTKRSANTEAGRTKGQRNRPIIQWTKKGIKKNYPRRSDCKNWNNITEMHARKRLGFRSLLLKAFPLADNAANIEDEIQRIIMNDFGYKKIGKGQLFREIAKGSDYSGQIAYFKVFMTYTH